MNTRELESAVRALRALELHMAKRGNGHLVRAAIELQQGATDEVNRLRANAAALTLAAQHNPVLTVDDARALQERLSA